MVLVTVLSVVVGLLFLTTGGVKIVGLRQSLEIRDHFGMSPGLWRIIGALECCGALGVLAGLAVKPLGVAAAAGLIAPMLGAIASRLRVRDPLRLIAFDVTVLVLVAITFAVRIAT